jgi:integrase/recombinase XerD
LLPKGKTVARRNYVIWCAAYLHTWISSHPLKDDGEAYLFCSNREPFNVLSQTGLWEQVKVIAKRAGIKKRIYIHLFRHTRATQLAQQGFSNQEMNVEMGWTAGSVMFNTYVNLAGVNTDNKKRVLAGLQIIEPVKAGIRTMECPRCHRVNPIDADRCFSCRTAISKAEVDKDKALEEAKKEAEKQALKSEIMGEFEKRLTDALAMNERKKSEYVEEPLTDEQNDVLNKPENQFPHEIISDGILHDIEVSPEDMPEKDIDVVNRVLKTDKKE